MAGKSINVKVARTKVIKALEVKVEEMQNAQMNYELVYAKYETDIAQWRKEVAELALSHKDSILGENVTINEAGSWRVPNGFIGVELSFHLPISVANAPQPQAPAQPFQSNGYGRDYLGNYDQRIAEIQNAIRVLNMSDEEVVSTSTYQSVSRYL
jgi:hypothetical protein